MDSGEFREAGRRIVELLARRMERVEEGPVLPRGADPAALARSFAGPLPVEPAPLDALVTELEEKLLPWCTQLDHPGYMGLITPSPAPAGVLGDFIASALNQNVGAWTIGPSAVALERQVVRWLTDLAGYGPAAGGNLTSGGMMANFIGLKLARDAASGDRAQHDGVTGRWAAYTSEERHVSVDKAADAIGIGRNGLRVMPTDDRFEIRLDRLEQALADDRAAGIRPLAIVAMGGSTNTGAVDPLRPLRRIADRVGAWLHVDAAYGGGMLLSERHPGVLDGLELADSVTLDPHKWFFAPLDAGAILVRDGARLTRSFGIEPPYLTDSQDAGGERYNYYVHGFEQSRRFRGLKVWMSFRRYGSRQIGRWIDANIAQARRLYELAAAHPDFESAMQPRMSAVCVGYRPQGVAAERLGRLHGLVARRIEEGGRFWFSTTVLKGAWYFRVNPVNFATRLEHMDELFDVLVAECGRAAQDGGEGR